VNALILTLFVSLVLAALAVVAFVFVVGQRDHEHNDRLSLLPLEDDAVAPAQPDGARPSSAPLRAPVA
jgi:cbb3-type cytochrome oxidase subunit 3